MGAFEKISGQLVVEPAFFPAVTYMAILACLGGVVFDVEVPFVDIAVTIYAFLSNSPEFPFLIYEMAFETGCSGMCTVEFEFGLVVIGYGVQGDIEPVHRMAFAAVRSGTIGHKLAFVVIGMAGGAVIVG